jgi:glycosyltransferase involved in cell wall biosynthesis
MRAAGLMDRAAMPIVAVDPGFLPTTRQMALAVADRLSAYYTPYVANADSRLLALPRIGRQVVRRMLPPELESKARLVETGTELLRLTLSRAGVHALDYQLIWRRNIGLDAHLPSELQAGGTVIGQYGGCLESFRRSRVLYGRNVLDYPIARVEYANQLLAEEAALRPDFADTMRGTSLAPEHRERINAELQLADMIVVGSRFAADSFAGVADPQRVRVMPYGVDTAAFRPRIAPRAQGPLRVLFAGQLTQRKGVAYALDAMRMLDRSKVRLVLAGPAVGSGRGLSAYDGEFEHVVGARPQDMPHVYGGADVLVLPSLIEGSALVVLEAMASGIPVIVTSNAGADAVRDGIDGFVVPLRSPEAIAARLEELRRDPALRERMGAAARARSEAFTWEAFRRNFRIQLGLPVETPAQGEAGEWHGREERSA